MIAGRCTRTAGTGAAWCIVFSEAAGEGSALLPYRFLGDFWRFLEVGSVEVVEVVRSGAECRGVEADRRRGGRFRLEECHVFMIKSTATAGIITKSPPFWR